MPHPKGDRIYKPIPAFKPDDHKGCSGHSICMLDSTFETKDEVDLMKKILDHYIKYPRHTATA